MAVSIGDRVGPYEILSALGAGGMGEVFQALDTRLGRTVALKVLPAAMLSDTDRVERFAAEARAASALNHPNIITVHDVALEGSLPFIVMELVEGQTLREMLTGSPLPLKKVLTLAAQIADGLAKAHGAGIVHRDLKPENVMVSKDGFVKILDFGLAKLAQPAADSAEPWNARTRNQTQPGMILGTVGYMSPEQATGRPVDFRSDQFSFGAVLYELLTGKQPFHRASVVETQAAIVKEEPVAIAELNPLVPAPLRWIGDRCLAKDPDDRYGATQDLARDLQTLRTHVSGAATGFDLPRSGVPPAHRLSGARFWLGLAAGLLAGAGLVFIALSRSSADTLEPPTVRYLTYSGRDASPAASQDGRLVAFSSDRDGLRKIWLKQLSGGAEAALTGGEDDYPRFSPDGSMVLFVRTTGNSTALYRVATLGGEPRKLLDDVVDGDWAPDGRRLAFIRWHTAGGVAHSTVWVMQADGAAQRQIADFPHSQLVHPRWSPDGRTIAAVTRVQQAGLPHRILLIDSDGNGSRALSPESGVGGPSAIAWSGDGRDIVYLQAASVGGHATGSAARLIRQQVDSGRSTMLMWSANSGLVFDILAPGRAVFDGRSSRENLQEIPLETGATVAGTRWLTRGNSSDRQPVYSPDGEWIVFTSNRGGNLDLWALSTRTGSVRPVTDDAAEDWDPSFAMGGRKLLWSSNRSGHFEVWMAEPDGSGARQVSHDGIDAENPTATPDGGWIVYNSGNPAHPGVWKIRPDGSSATRLVTGSTLLPEVSPDGKYVLYLTEWRTRRPTIRVADVATGRPVPFTIAVDTTKTFLDVGRARWMPGARSIAFLGEDAGGLLGIFTQDFTPGADTARSRRPLGGFGADFATESFGVAGDGRRLTLANWEQLSSIMSADGLTGVVPPRRRP